MSRFERRSTYRHFAMLDVDMYVITDVVKKPSHYEFGVLYICRRTGRVVNSVMDSVCVRLEDEHKWVRV